eukprot:CAMPEP_0206606716 /NCGR_PEP_ID=MMETSP0325_2-20121206/51579_1 /ASSEMBLY_ACC=CAM_ASM_000347 /TAXON_ID=2866 /ORGANISM="Crypthecodinium cohnii, Strain Seligo" /LENGTH=644 /DNA_ID=CAMNT_0054123309 /DNA_START=62 /DNA_END=1996 /DNA_ORIENTATION=+
MEEQEEAGISSDLFVFDSDEELFLRAVAIAAAAGVDIQQDQSQDNPNAPQQGQSSGSQDVPTGSRTETDRIGGTPSAPTSPDFDRDPNLGLDSQQQELHHQHIDVGDDGQSRARAVSIVDSDEDEMGGDEAEMRPPKRPFSEVSQTSDSQHFPILTGIHHVTQATSSVANQTPTPISETGPHHSLSQTLPTSLDDLGDYMEAAIAAAAAATAGATAAAAPSTTAAAAKRTAAASRSVVAAPSSPSSPDAHVFEIEDLDSENDDIKSKGGSSSNSSSNNIPKRRRRISRKTSKTDISSDSATKQKNNKNNKASAPALKEDKPNDEDEEVSVVETSRATATAAEALARTNEVDEKAEDEEPEVLELDERQGGSSGSRALVERSSEEARLKVAAWKDLREQMVDFVNKQKDAIEKQAPTVPVLLDILEELSDCIMDDYLLRKTGIGKTIASLRKNADNEVVTKASALVTQWKRDRQTRMQVTDILQKRGKLPTSDAKRLEDSVFHFACPYGLEVGDDKKEYQRHYLRICNHLKESGPGCLMEKLKSGEIWHDEVAFLPDEALLSDAKKQKLEAVRQEALKEALITTGAQHDGTPSEQYTCPGCNSTQCLYKDVQTGWHNDQQDVTILVQCLNCKYRWKANDDHGLGG